MAAGKKRPPPAKKTPPPRKRQPAPTSAPTPDAPQAVTAPPPGDADPPELMRTEAQVAAALRENLGLIQLTADSLGVHRITLWTYFKRWPKLRQIQQEARKRPVDKAERLVEHSIDQGDVGTAKWYLERKGRNRGYATRTESRVGGDPAAPPVKVQHEHFPLDALPLAQKIAILEAVKAARARQQQEQPHAANG